MYECIECSFSSSNFTNYNNHLNTKKHKNRNKQYFCSHCDFGCGNNSYNWNRHISTQKHKRKCLITEIVEKENKENKENIVMQIETETEEELENVYITNKNQQKVQIIPENIIVSNEILPNAKITDNVILKLIMQNEEMKNLLVEQNKEVVTQNRELTEEMKQQNKLIIEKMTQNIMISNNSNNVNSNNKFNLNFFLNEQCRDAMTVSEFLNFLHPTLDDMKENVKIGYVEGFNKCINSHLNEVGIYKRPFHCIDEKRETIMYKNDDCVWVKDVDNEVLFRIINKMESMKLRLLKQHSDENPEIIMHYHPDTYLFMDMMRAAFAKKPIQEKLARKLIKSILVPKLRGIEKSGGALLQGT